MGCVFELPFAAALLPIQEGRLEGGHAVAVERTFRREGKPVDALSLAISLRWSLLTATRFKEASFVLQEPAPL